MLREKPNRFCFRRQWRLAALGRYVIFLTTFPRVSNDLPDRIRSGAVLDKPFPSSLNLIHRRSSREKIEWPMLGLLQFPHALGERQPAIPLPLIIIAINIGCKLRVSADRALPAGVSARPPRAPALRIALRVRREWRTSPRGCQS